jgi:hypothetical protein
MMQHQQIYIVAFRALSNFFKAQRLSGLSLFQVRSICFERRIALGQVPSKRTKSATSHKVVIDEQGIRGKCVSLDDVPRFRRFMSSGAMLSSFESGDSGR